jgi:putative transposase
MPKGRNAEKNIVGVVRQVEAGERVANLCRKVGICETNYDIWKRRHSATEASDSVTSD